MKFLSTLTALALASTAVAQQSSGTIYYEEVMTIKVELPPEMQQMAHLIPTEQKSQASLSFTAQESLYKAVEADQGPATKQMENDEGQTIEINATVIGGGANTTTYYNLADKEGLRSENMMGKDFLVELGWYDFEWSVACLLYTSDAADD